MVLRHEDYLRDVNAGAGKELAEQEKRVDKLLRGQGRAEVWEKDLAHRATIPALMSAYTKANWQCSIVEKEYGHQKFESKCRVLIIKSSIC